MGTRDSDFIVPVLNNSMDIILGRGVQCTIIRNPSYSLGYFAKDDPTQHLFPSFLIRVALFWLLSKSFYFALRRLRQPRFVSDVLAGCVLGPNVLGVHVPQTLPFFIPEAQPVFQNFAWLGIAYYVFLHGVKMNTGLSIRTGKKIWSIAVVGVVGAAIGYPASLWLYTKDRSIFNQLQWGLLVLLFVTSPFPVVVESLDELNLLTSELGRLATSAAMIVDGLRWIFMSIDASLVDHSSQSLVFRLASLLGLTVFMRYVIQPVLHWVAKRTPAKQPVAPHYHLAILVGVPIMAFVSGMLGITIVIGPLLLGLAVPNGMPIGIPLVEKTERFIVDVLLPFFFLLFGYFVNLSYFTPTVFIEISSIIFICCLGKFVGVTLAAMYHNMSLRHAATLGLMMNVKGWPEIITILHWARHKMITAGTFPSLLASVVLVTGIVTPLIELLYKPPWRLNRNIDKFGHTIETTPPDIEFRVLSCVYDIEDVESMAPLLRTSNSDGHRNLFCAYMIHLVGLTGTAAPLFATYEKYRQMMGGEQATDQVVAAFEKSLSDSDSQPNIKPFAMIVAFKSMYEGICKLADDDFIPLIMVPHHNNRRSQAAQSNILRDINVQIQAMAPCSVGLLVDRGLGRHVNTMKFSYRIAVIFLGGPDDRETLAFASRLSAHPAVSTTIWRINTSNIVSDTASTGSNSYEDNLEKQLDDAVVSEFRLKNIKNTCAVYHEIRVEDAEQLWDAIRSLDNNYDLVMVGKEPSCGKLLQSDLLDLDDENSELGVVGDMLASSEFHGGMVSVLVMQHYREADRSFLDNAMSVFD
ncbi:Cation/H+ exchanger [Dillenia turbinata]|uniref:Cation/H+ exchanger n=1 Tax=Dillenia turbinata TaxID=194707 RepID=A0AAN8V2T3_9MAGN